MKQNIHSLLTKIQLFCTVLFLYPAIVNAQEADPCTHYDSNGFRKSSCMCDGIGEYQPAVLTDGWYEISNAGQLYWFANYVNNASSNTKTKEEVLKSKGKLMADIVINDGSFDEDGNFTATGASEISVPREWVSICNGTNSVLFKGQFDGQMHTISGLYINQPSSSIAQGLFSSIYYASINNVGIVNSYIQGKDKVGAICGYSNYTSNWSARSNIHNCWNTSRIKGTSNVGGILGNSNYCTSIADCWNSGKVSGTNNSTVAGIAVILSNYDSHAGSEIVDCYNIGEIVGPYVHNPRGISVSRSTNCYTTGNYQNEDASVHKVTTEQFTSGEVCFLLNHASSTGELAWHQYIANESAPQLSGSSIVYRGYVHPETCSNEVGYSNDPATYSTTRGPHNYINGFCETSPGEVHYEPAVLNGDTYEISNAGQLYWFAGIVGNELGICDYDATTNPTGTRQNNTAKARLMNDITINPGTCNFDGTYTALSSETPREWMPIGRKKDNTNNNSFCGILDGQKHIISGLYYNGTQENIGLVGVGNGCKVFSVGIENTYLKGGKNAGSIFGSAGNGASATNCYSKATVSSTSNVGGLGASEYTTFTNCYYSGYIYGYPRKPVGSGCTNCYYNVYNYNINENNAGGAKKTNNTELASGKIAYLLNGSTSEGELMWYQKIGTDSYPTFVQTEGSIVYGQTNYKCDGVTVESQNYSNDSEVEDVIASHTYGSTPKYGDNGFGIKCDVCSALDAETLDRCEPAKLNNGWYEIGNAGQLYWFANLVNTSQTDANTKAKLVEDIVDNENVIISSALNTDNNVVSTFRAWTPIGKDDTNAFAFKGTFDGQNHTISGLYCNKSTSNYIGLFGYAAGAGNLISGVGVVDSYFMGKVNVGSIAGQSASNIERCFSNSVVIGTNNVGGIIGYKTNTSYHLMHCYFAGNVKGTNEFTGGICGNAANGTKINNNYMIGTYSGTSCRSTIGNRANTKNYALGDGYTLNDFKSGRITWLLNGTFNGNTWSPGTTDGTQVWYQRIGEDDYPTFIQADGKTVYEVVKDMVYVNENGSLGSFELVDNTTSFISPVAFNVESLTYSRDVTGGKTITFALPFAIPVSNINGKVFKLNKYDGSTLSFKQLGDSESTEANVPYLMVADAEATELLKAPVDNAAIGVVTNDTKAICSVGNASHYGTYTQEKGIFSTDNVGVYGYSGGMFYIMKKQTAGATGATLNPFRTLIKITNNASAKSSLMVSLDEETTGVMPIVNDSVCDDLVDVYSLDGHKLRSAVSSITCLYGLPNGVYIVNGRKIVKK